MEILTAGEIDIEYKVLEGENILLSPFNPKEDSQELFNNSHTSNKEQTELLWKYRPIGPFKSKEEFQIQHEQKASVSSTYSYTVIDKNSNRKIGMICFMNNDIKNKVVEIGAIWYAPEFQRTYANRESCFLMIDHAITVHKYRRVQWSCANHNENSKNAAIKLGFQFEGVFRQYLIMKGENWDKAWFSILDKEWPKLKAEHIQKFESYKNLNSKNV